MLRIALLPSWQAYLVHLVGLRLEVEGRGPGTRPRRRVFDRHLIAQGVGVHAPEPLGQHQLVARAAVRRAAVEVGGADHQRVTLPVRAGVAEVLAQMRRQGRTAVDRHHARLVDHLVADRDIAGALHQPGVGVVDGGIDGVGHAAGDAAVVEGEVLVAVERAVAEAAPDAALLARPRLGAERRHPSVGRIDHHRSPARRLPALEPMRRRRGGRADGTRIGSVRRLDLELGVVGGQLLGGLRLARGELRLGQGLAFAELGRPLERHAQLGLAGPKALQVGLAPRRLEGAGRRLAMDHCQAGAQQHREKNETLRHEPS